MTLGTGQDGGNKVRIRESKIAGRALNYSSSAIFVWI
jgi:hypothetical protein